MRQGACIICLALAACSPSQSDELNYDDSIAAVPFDANVSAASTTAALPADPGPQRRYDERDGDIYYYVSAVSEEDRQKGRATGTVVGFRYLGKVGDVYRLQSVSGSGLISECRKPCRIIKNYYSGGSLTPSAFSPTSIIGAAFTDAFNGFLKPAQSPSRTEPVLAQNAAPSTPPPVQATTDWMAPETDPVVNDLNVVENGLENEL